MVFWVSGTGLCWRIGGMSAGEFSSIVALVDARQTAKNAVRTANRGLFGHGRAKGDEGEMPLVSVGPSGVGGSISGKWERSTKKNVNGLYWG